MDSHDAFLSKSFVPKGSVSAARSRFPERSGYVKAINLTAKERAKIATNISRRKRFRELGAGPQRFEKMAPRIIRGGPVKKVKIKLVNGTTRIGTLTPVSAAAKAATPLRQLVGA
jgi:hypothetical protein